jgi:hypothetical protein
MRSTSSANRASHTSHDAGNFWGKCTRIYAMDAHRVELNKNFE